MHRNPETSFLNGYTWEEGDFDNFKVEQKHSFMWRKIGRAGKILNIVYFIKYVGHTTEDLANLD